MLGLRQLLFLRLDLGVDCGFIATTLLVQLTDLILVGGLGASISEPRPVFPAVGPASHQTSILKVNVQDGLIRIQHDLRGLLGSLVSQTVEAAAHLNLAEIKASVFQFSRIQHGDIPPLRLEEIEHATAVLNGATEGHLAHLVSLVVLVDSIQEIGILPRPT